MWTRLALNNHDQLFKWVLGLNSGPHVCHVVRRNQTEAILLKTSILKIRVKQSSEDLRRLPWVTDILIDKVRQKKVGKVPTTLE